MPIHRILAFLITGILLHSCAVDNVMRTWSTSEDYDRHFNSIMIMGLINNVKLRSDVENEFAYASGKYNIQTSNGMSMFPPELGKPFEDVERAKSRMRAAGFEGVLAITLVDVRAERYSPPDVAYEPLVFYDRFGNYYYRTAEIVYRQGYYSISQRYYYEANFYDLKTGKLVWSGISRIVEPEEMDDFLNEFASELFKELKEQGVIQNS